MRRNGLKLRGAHWWVGGGFGLLVIALTLAFAGRTPAEALDGAMAVDCDATPAGVQVDCTYPVGAIFSVQVHATSAPSTSYPGWQSKLRWTDAVLDYRPADDQSTEAIWPNCSIPVRANNEPGDPSVLYGCSSFPAVSSTYTGPLAVFEFQCEAEGTTVLDLVPREGDDQLGTHFLDPELNPIDPALSVANLTCFLPPTATPTLTQTPSATATATRTPTATRTFTPTPTSTFTATPTPLPSELEDVTITKTDSPDPVEAEHTITYQLHVRNIGLREVSGVSVSDTLPPEVIFLSASPGCLLDTGVVTCAVGTLAANDNAPGGADETTLSIESTAPNTPVDIRISNLATVTATDEPFANAGNNKDIEETVVLAHRPDLTLEKLDSPDPILSGGTTTYTLRTRNQSLVQADDVVIEDVVPLGATVMSSSPECGPPAAGLVVCSLGSMAPGQETDLQIVVQAPVVTVDSLMKNVARVTASNEFFSHTGNNLAIQNTAVIAPPPDLAIDKVASSAQLLRARFFSYTLTVTNIGGGDAFDAIVADQLPANAIFVSATPGCGLFPGNVVACPVAFLPANSGQQVITVNVRAPGISFNKDLNNTASVSDADEPDDPGANNSDSAATRVIACFDNNDDNTVSILDIVRVVAAFGTHPPDPGYDLLFDSNGDGGVSVLDITLAVNQFGAPCSNYK